MKEIRIGLIGAVGWMGRIHALLYTAEPSVYGAAPARPKLEMVCELDPKVARQAAADYGAPRWTTDWREVVNDPRIDLVDIVTPNNLHHQIVMAAIAAGKHIYCEKPLAMNAAETAEMARAAQRKKVLTLVGHNYPHHPIHKLAREIIQSGELGRVTNFRGIYNVAFLADPAVPLIWRVDKKVAGSGTVGDITSHIFSFTQYLIGDIAELVANFTTVIARRPVAADARVGKRVTGKGVKTRAVETDDTNQVILKFANGAVGVIDSSRVHWGANVEIAYNIVGTQGALRWHYDRMGELHHFDARDPESRQGYKRIECGPQHPPYGTFMPVANLGFGYNEMKMIEIRQIIEAVAGRKTEVWPDFAVSHRIQCYIDAAIRSAAERRWVKVSEIG